MRNATLRELPGKRNVYLDRVWRLHAARLRLLPALGIPVGTAPAGWLVEQAHAAFDIAKSAYRKKRRATLEFTAPADRWLMRHVLARPLAGGAPSFSYIVYNAALATTAAPVKQPTGTAIRTMLQLKCAVGYFGKIIEWGASYDGSAAATPGQVELIETGAVGATALSTAFGVADIQPFEDPNSSANTAGTSGAPYNLGTSASGFATAAVTEGTTTASRMLDIQQLPPTGPYIKQFPLGREPGYGYYAAGAAAAQNYLRVRNTFVTTVNATYYLISEF
jgi:hypothetical protein